MIKNNRYKFLAQLIMVGIISIVEIFKFVYADNLSTPPNQPLNLLSSPATSSTNIQKPILNLTDHLVYKKDGAIDKKVINKNTVDQTEQPKIQTTPKEFTTNNLMNNLNIKTGISLMPTLDNNIKINLGSSLDPSSIIIPKKIVFKKPGVNWLPELTPVLFAQAKKENKFILLDLEAVWCHWCHVMEQQTYANPDVMAILKSHYLSVKVDQDSNPDLSNRYGDWGWPATIVLADDGTEIVKRKGYIPPENMVSLLQAIVDDPTPGPSITFASSNNSRTNPDAQINGSLSFSQKVELSKNLINGYDTDHGGWGDNLKFIDGMAMDFTLENEALAGIHGESIFSKIARKTLDQNLLLIDPVWGGVYQYSETVDWKNPHFEKIMSFQADDLRFYSLAYSRWKDPKYEQAATMIKNYIYKFLTSHDSALGAFYVSQDADLNPKMLGSDYYKLNEADRLTNGTPPVDKHIYSRENGWAIQALCSYSNATGDKDALNAAITATNWIIGFRSLPSGGFKHDKKDVEGPFLGDNVSMGMAFISLYKTTGEQQWLVDAIKVATFIQKKFSDPFGGFDTTPVDPTQIGVFKKPVLLYEENVNMVRFSNMIYRYTGDEQWNTLSKQGMSYLTSPQFLKSHDFVPGVLLANYEFSNAPVHITVVGDKNDEAAIMLHKIALTYPADYLRVDWIDKNEKSLIPINSDIKYPEFSQSAAYICTATSCSSPIFSSDKLDGIIKKIFLSNTK